MEDNHLSLKVHIYGSYIYMYRQPSVKLYCTHLLIFSDKRVKINAINIFVDISCSQIPLWNTWVLAISSFMSMAMGYMAHFSHTLARYRCAGKGLKRTFWKSLNIYSSNFYGRINNYFTVSTYTYCIAATRVCVILHKNYKLYLFQWKSWWIACLRRGMISMSNTASGGDNHVKNPSSSIVAQAERALDACAILGTFGFKRCLSIMFISYCVDQGLRLKY